MTSSLAPKKLDVARRQFLKAVGGLGASFLAINEVSGRQFSNATSDGQPVSADQPHLIRSSMNGGGGGGGGGGAGGGGAPGGGDERNPGPRNAGAGTGASPARPHRRRKSRRGG